MAAFRDQGGTLGLCGGLRVLGASRKSIVERVQLLKRKKITPYDLDTGGRDETALLDIALRKINGGRALKEDPRVPRRIGRKGGLAKGLKAQAKRDALLAEDIVIRLWRHPKLNGEDVAKILGEPWSETTLHRKYGPRN